MGLFALMIVGCCFAGEEPARVDPLVVAVDLAETRFKGYAYASEGEQKIDCTQFVLAVAGEVAKKRGVELSKATKARITVSDLTADEKTKLQSLVDDKHPKIRGIASALVEAGHGVAVDPADAAPGDFVQYWYKENDRWVGHSGIVERVEGGKATIYGSHKTTLQRERELDKKDRKGGIGSGPEFDLKDAKRRVFVVRWKA